MTAEDVDLLWGKLPPELARYGIDLLGRLVLIDRADDGAAALLVGGMPPGSAAALADDNVTELDRRGIRVLTAVGRTLVRQAAENADIITEIAAARVEHQGEVSAEVVDTWLADHDEKWGTAVASDPPADHEGAADEPSDMAASSSRPTALNA